MPGSTTSPPASSAAKRRYPPLHQSKNPTIQQSNNPTIHPLWLEADLDLPRISSALALGWNLPTNFPRILLTAQADDAGVRTRAKLDFPEPLPLELEAWNIPTNLIHDPLIGFTAVRGIRPWLKSFKPWQASCSIRPAAEPGLLLGPKRPRPVCIFWQRPRRMPATRCTG